MVLEFDFNVHALKDSGGFPGNLWLRIYADDAVMVDLQVYDAHSADSGWKGGSISFTINSPPKTVTTVFYMIDESSETQEFWLDNIEMAN
jgi:hypothetical protein